MADSKRSYSPIGSRREQDPNYAPVFVRGEGAYLWDDQGRRYIDFVSGYSSTLFGHAHPRLVAVAREQVATLTQLVGLRHPWREELEQELARRVEGNLLRRTEAPHALESSGLTASEDPHPRPLSHKNGRGEVKTWLTTTGARAVEVAWKMAFAYRPGRVMSFDAAYHGRSLATGLLSDTKRLPIVEGAVDSSLRFPRCDRCPVGMKRESCNAECFDEDEKRIEDEAEQISAVFVEPALGARGYYFAPPTFFQRLRDVTKRFGIILIDDEVQMGLGRLGSFIAAQRQGWEPDLVVLGKSLGGGIVPIAAVIGTTEIVDSLTPGIESETFAANPFACRIALESLSILDDERLCERAKQIEERFGTLLEQLRSNSGIPFSFDVFGASAVIQTTPETAGSLARQTVEHGLMVHWSGIERDRLVLIPPLTVTEAIIADAFAILGIVMST